MSEIGEPGGDSTPSLGEGGGIIGFLSTLRGVVTAIATLVIAISGLITALKATGVIDGDDEPTPTVTTEATTTGDEGFGLFSAATRTNGDVYFEDGTMYVVAKKKGKPFMQLADLDEELGDVSVSGRLEGPRGGDFGAGFVCRHQGLATFYVLSILSEGRFAILRYRDGRTTLARGVSGAIRDGANDVVARCLGDRPTTLSLTVNGSNVGRAQDAEGIETGSIGVRVGTNDPPARIRFDRVVLR